MVRLHQTSPDGRALRQSLWPPTTPWVGSDPITVTVTVAFAFAFAFALTVAVDAQVFEASLDECAEGCRPFKSTSPDSWSFFLFFVFALERTDEQMD